jgi:hypothetical protein
MNEKRAHELRSIIEQLESPISADRVAIVTAVAAMRILELWMEVEAREADIEHLRQLQTSGRQESKSDGDAPGERWSAFVTRFSLFVCSQRSGEVT